MRKTVILAAMAVGTLVAGAAPATAQYYDPAPRGYGYERGYREAPPVYREQRGYRGGISEGQAAAIARSGGMYQMVRITGGNGRVWRVTGIDRGGREIRMMIDDQSGRIVARERE